MSNFWDEYVEITGDWIGLDELTVLIDNGIPVTVTAVTEDQQNQYGPRYILQLKVPDPETGEEKDRIKGFGIGSVESRDRQMAQMIAYFEREDSQPIVGKFTQVGRSKLFVAA